MMANAISPNTPGTFRVAVVGGGLAGLAAAAALCERDIAVELFEAKRHLGGRAGSFLDQTTGELVDHCQHVAMGCCTNYLDFCQRTGIADLFVRYRTLHFFGPDGRRSDFRSSRWLPAPLHLLPALLGLKYLSLAEKIAIGRSLLRLARLSSTSLSVLAWLQQQRQSPRAIERFWRVVLVSALGESLDRASLSAARKVFLDGFLAHPDACDMLVPKVSLSDLYDRRVADWLRERGVAIHLDAPIDQVTGSASRASGIRRAGVAEQPFNAIIVAVPWRRAAELFAPEILSRVPQVTRAADFAAAPITGVHLWFDRPLTELPHAVLVGRLSQWMFRRNDFQSVGERQIANPPGEHYYQVVISASHELAGRERQAIVDEVVGDLQAVFPAARDARLLRWKLITQPDAVFSVRPGLDEHRPPQETPVPGLLLAGDWTSTLWPATMEGAVRSGYLAAQAVLAQQGRPEKLPEKLVVADLPRSWLIKALGAGGAGR